VTYRFLKVAWLASWCWALSSLGIASAAVPASEALLPNTTKGYLSVPNVDLLLEQWNKTQLGQLMNDPIMQPFVEDFRDQLRNRWSQSHEKLGITWEDLQGVPGGEVAIAMIEPAKNEAAMALVVDTSGHDAERKALLDKIHANLTVRKAKISQRDVYGARVTVYDLPKTEDHPARQVLIAAQDNLLAVSDNAKVIEGILSRAGGGTKDSLSELDAFAGVMRRAADAAGDQKPNLRWFIEPFGYVEAMRAASTQPRRKGQDMLKVLAKQGFTAIEGIGGYVNLASDQYEMLHRTAIYAPGNKQAKEKYKLAARMLKFPNGGDLRPQPWVPRELASYSTFNLDMKNAFESSSTLVNEIVGDEVFEDVLDSILTDPNGPKIDIRKDLVAHLGSRATVLADYELPITTKSERMLFAAETTNGTALAATIDKSMRTDPEAHQRSYNGHIIWEIIEEKSQLPMVTIENAPPFGPNAGGGADDEEEHERVLPNSAVTVAHGHLLVATHIDFLIKILDKMDSRDQLSAAADYQIVQTELDKLGVPEVCARIFTRTDEQSRAVYELIKSGEMPESESMLGRLLNSMLGDAKTGVPRKQRIDGKNLPDYDAVRRYFGPSGTIVTSEPDGWFLTGFTLAKSTQ
jgi:hypothetical protein